MRVASELDSSAREVAFELYRIYVAISLVDLFQLHVYSIASSSSANTVESGNEDDREEDYEDDADNENNDEDDDALNVPAAVGITFVVTLALSVLVTLVIVYIVYKMKKKPATDEARMAFNSTLMTDRASTIKVPQSSCDDENYEFPDNMEQTESATRYQKSPSTTMQPNPAYGVTQSTDVIYENVN